MVVDWLVALIISVAINVAAMVITPRPRAAKPLAVEQAQNPTADAGKPIPVLFGKARISETNIIGFWDKSTRQYEIKV